MLLPFIILDVLLVKTKIFVLDILLDLVCKYLVFINHTLVINKALSFVISIYTWLK